MKPGRRVTSPRSTTLAPAGTATLVAEPTATMRSPVTTIAALITVEAPVPSIILAARRTVVCWAKAEEATAHKTTAKEPIEVRCMLCLTGVNCGTAGLPAELRLEGSRCQLVFQKRGEIRDS